MKHLFYISLAGLMSLIGKPVLAQDDTLFNRHLTTVLENFFSIKGQIPEGFTVLRTTNPIRIPIGKNRNAEDQAKGFYDFHFLKSVDKECLLLYPIIPAPYFDKRIDRPPYNRITSALTRSLGIPPEQADSLFVFDDHVTTVTGKLAREMFNADSIHFYDIPLEEPFEEGYVYCTGVVITKADRASLYFKWYFTEEGKKNEKDYIQRLEGKLWFEEEWRVQKEAERARNLKSDIKELH